MLGSVTKMYRYISISLKSIKDNSFHKGLYLFTFLRASSAYRAKHVLFREIWNITFYAQYTFPYGFRDNCTWIVTLWMHFRTCIVTISSIVPKSREGYRTINSDFLNSRHVVFSSREWQRWKTIFEPCGSRELDPLCPRSRAAFTRC